MNRSYAIALAAALAVGAGCSSNKNHATTRPANGKMAMSSKSATTKPAAAAPALAPDYLAGSWQLAVPRSGIQQATITATDNTHVTITAGDNLSGDYVVQGNYLLILTQDEHLRPLAWRINSADSLTVVRSTETGDYTGATLVRAAADHTAAAPADADQAESGADPSETLVP
jgi:hypothetical protein